VTFGDDAVPPTDPTEVGGWRRLPSPHGLHASTVLGAGQRPQSCQRSSRRLIGRISARVVPDQDVAIVDDGGNEDAALDEAQRGDRGRSNGRELETRQQPAGLTDNQ